MKNNTPNYSYEKITADVRNQVEQVAGTVREHIAKGEHKQAQNLAASLWGAFCLWDRITRSDQQDGHAATLEVRLKNWMTTYARPQRLDPLKTHSRNPRPA